MSGLSINFDQPQRTFAVAFTKPGTGEPLAYLELDGTLTIVSDEYTPNEAARMLWDAVKQCAP